MSRWGYNKVDKVNFWHGPSNSRFRNRQVIDWSRDFNLIGTCICWLSDLEVASDCKPAMEGESRLGGPKPKGADKRKTARNVKTAMIPCRHGFVCQLVGFMEYQCMPENSQCEFTIDITKTLYHLSLCDRFEKRGNLNMSKLISQHSLLKMWDC